MCDVSIRNNIRKVIIHSGLQVSSENWLQLIFNAFSDAC